jgi:hypothetical protein
MDELGLRFEELFAEAGIVLSSGAEDEPGLFGATGALERDGQSANEAGVIAGAASESLEVLKLFVGALGGQG